MATKNELIARNASIQAEITTLNTQRATAQTNHADWLRDAQALGTCDYTLKSKREACIADRSFKNERAAYHLGVVRAAEAKIKMLQQEYESNLASIASVDEQARLLAVKGIDVQANEIKANAEATAVIVKAQSEAAIAVDKAAAETTKAVDDNKQRNMIILIIAIILFLAIAIAVAKKLKKSSKK